MRLSVIILALNHGKTLGELLKRLAEQDVTEVVVADAGSKDDTVAVARRFGADVSRSSDGVTGELLNAAARLTSCDVLLFLPGDASISMDLGNRVLDYLEAHPEAIGTQFNLRPSSRLMQGVRSLLGSPAKTHNIPAFAVLRHLFLKIGGFPAGEEAVAALMSKLANSGAMPVLRQNVTVSSQ